MQQAGWISTTPVGAVPALARHVVRDVPERRGPRRPGRHRVVVLGSYFLASELQVRRPTRRARARSARHADAREQPAQPALEVAPRAPRARARRRARSRAAGGSRRPRSRSCRRSARAAPPAPAAPLIPARSSSASITSPSSLRLRAAGAAAREVERHEVRVREQHLVGRRHQRAAARPPGRRHPRDRAPAPRRARRRACSSISAVLLATWL